MADDNTPAPTFESALEAAAGSSPAEQTTQSDSSASTTAAPADSATTTTTTGEPPQERWADILANARTKAAEERDTHWRQNYGWAEQVNRDQVASMVEYFNRAKSDPNSFLQEYVEHIAATNPQALAQARSLFARQLAAGRGGDDPEPPADRQAEDGTLLYSAPQLKKWHEWNWRQQQAWVTEQIQPLQHHRQQSEQAAKVAELQRAAHQEASAVIAEAKTWPGFEKHQAEIRSAMEADPKLSLERAYIRVTAKTLPQEAQAEVVAQFKEKAQAATEKPGAAPSKPKNYKGNFEKALEDAFAAASSR